MLSVYTSRITGKINGEEVPTGAFSWPTCTSASNSISDPHSFNTNPYPAYNFNADPDPDEQILHLLCVIYCLGPDLGDECNVDSCGSGSETPVEKRREN